MADVESGQVHVKPEAGICRITIDRPARKNALSLAMYQQLADAVTSANEDSAIRVLLLSGSAGNFTSGNDLGDFLKHKGNLSEEENPTPKFMRALIYCDKPVVAAVQGPAVGIGTTLLLHCDLVYADSSAYFQLPFVNLGLCPEFSSSAILPKLMGHGRAAELLYLGQKFSAEVAHSVGIVNAVTADSELANTVNAVCTRLSQQPASALRATKRLLKRELREYVFTIMENEAQHFKQGLKSPEFAEAVAAFAEKRTPDFSKFS